MILINIKIVEYVRTIFIKRVNIQCFSDKFELIYVGIDYLHKKAMEF